MSIIELPDEIKAIIERNVAEGRAATEAEFLALAVQRYADALDMDEDAIVAAADDGIADIAAGRFEVLGGADDLRRMTAELVDDLNARRSKARAPAPE